MEQAGQETAASGFPKIVEQATAAMREVFPLTPLQHNLHVSTRYGGEIYLKREDLTPVRSYKLRGAFNAMRKALATYPERTRFVCASAGNHAQGVAFMCRHFGVEGVIFMPVTTPGQKIDKTRAFGGGNVTIRLIGDYFDDTLVEARRWCGEVEAHFLAPFDDPDVIEGQASVAVEILAQMKAPPDLVILPVGGGGLSAGVVSYMAQKAPDTEFRLVEPRGAASLAAALSAGRPVTLPKVDNFVDGAAVARIGELPFAVLSRIDRGHVMAIPENRLCATIIEMLNVEGVVLEPAGALSINALEELREVVRGKRVVCVTSGGNFDFERLPDVRERAQRYAGLKKYFILRMAQRPGALREFLDLLGPGDDIARFEYLKKSARNFGSVLIGIESAHPEALGGLVSRMDAAGLIFRDITNDEILAEFLI